MRGVGRSGVKRRLLGAVLVAGAVGAVMSGCSLLQPAPAPTVTVTLSPTVTPTPTPSPEAPTPTTPTPQAVEPVEPPQPPPAPLPPTPPNSMGGQTDGGNTPNTPVVTDTGSQEFAVGPTTQVTDYEYTYVVQKGDQVLAIASRFQLQTEDVVRVNFRCSDPLAVQPGDVLDIRWPVDSEQVGSGC